MLMWPHKAPVELSTHIGGMVYKRYIVEHPMQYLGCTYL